MSLRQIDERLVAGVVHIFGAAGRSRFGTGFVIDREGSASVVLTCAHVVSDVGGPEGLRVDDLEAAVVALGDAQGIDLAVLRVAGLDREPLPLPAPGSRPGDDEPLRLMGYQKLGPITLLQPLTASLGDLAVISPADPRARARAWWLKLTGERGLEPGFSGSPVLNLASGQVLGVVSLRQGSGAGLAIAIDELPRVWGDCPSGLFGRQGLATHEVQPGAGQLDPAQARAAADVLNRLLARLPQELHGSLDALADALLPVIAAALAAGRARSSAPISAAGAPALNALAGSELRAGQAAIAFGGGAQFGDLTVSDPAGRPLVSLSLYLGEGERTAEEALPEPPEPALARPIAVYVGAGLPGDEPAQALRRQLGLRGLRGWPDEMNGPAQGAALQTGLEESAAGALYLSHERRDDGELAAEVAALRARRERARPLPTRVLLDGPAPVAAAQLGLGLDRPGDGVERYEAGRVGEAAGRLLRAALAAHEPRLINGGEIEIGLFTFPPAAAGAGATLLLDWRPCFAPFPSAEQWRDELMPALDDLREALGRAGVTRIRLYPQARTSASLAFGYVFRRETGVQLAIPQRLGDWQTGGPAGESAFDGVVTPVEADGRDLTIELPVTQSRPVADVDRWMAATGASLHTRVRLARRASGDIGAAEAWAMAGQVRSAILAHKRAGGVTHLVGAIPAGLAALIGWSLNACGLVQSYELRDDELHPACRVG